MMRFIFSVIGAADAAIGAIARAARWLRARCRITARSRLLAAFTIGLLLMAAIETGGEPGDLVFVVYIVGAVVWCVCQLANDPTGETANHFAIRVAKEHGVTATLHVTKTIIVCDAPTWHAIEAKHPRITDDGRIEVAS